jgi:uncharacterized protein (DUF169 family)
MSQSNILELMDTGYPVAIRFVQDAASSQTDMLFCELVQSARNGNKVTFSEQGCPVGAYVLGRDAPRPDDYYHRSGRYKNRASAAEAAISLPRLVKQYTAIQLFPLTESSDIYDIVLLFLSPNKAMQTIQAQSYHTGLPIEFRTGGIASICGDCTASAENNHQLCISLGCKGSRKHSKYGDDEVIVGIPKILVIPIQDGLDAIPEVLD